jgi:cytidylate kinase
MVITISREYGSGGSEIGHKLAEKRGIPCDDKTVAELTSDLTGFPGHVIHAAQDKYANGIDYMGGFGYGLYSHNTFLPVFDQIFFAQSKAILQLASQSDCMFVGRCASHVLGREGIDSFDIFIYAPMAERVKRISKIENLDEKAATKLINKNDKARANYYHKYADAEWGKPQNYHVCINSALGTDNVVQYLADVIKDRFLVK